MMKRALVGAAVAALVLVPSVGHAQRRASSARSSSSSDIKFSMAGGVVMPMSNFGDAVGTGFHLEGMGTKKLVSAPVWLRGELNVAMFGSKTWSTFAGDYKTSANQLAGMFDVGYDFVTTTSAKPYVLGGLGMHHTTSKTTTPFGSSSGSSNDLGVNLGGGMRFKMGTRVAFVEARYITAGDAGSFPIAFGVNF